MLFGALAAPTLTVGEPLSFDELIKLEGNDFVTAADESRYLFYGDRQFYGTDQLITVAERLLSSIKPFGERPDDYQLSPFTAYFEAACKKPNNQQLDKLIEIYRRLDPNTFEKSSALPALAACVLARQVAAMPAQHVELVSEDEAVLPAELKSAPEELQHSWRAFKRAKAGYDNAFPQTTGQIEVSANMKSFYNLVGDALSGATGREDEVRHYAWTGANCMGITDVEDAQDVAMLLMLLREERTTEAIGAALRVTGTEGSGSKPEASAKAVIDLFERCGLNWEEIFAGGQVDNEMKGWDYGSKSPYLDALASHGSAKAASLVKQLAYLAKPKARDKYLAVFGCWVETDSDVHKCKGEEVSFSSSDQKKRISKPMPQVVQEMALHMTEELVTTESSEYQADIAADTFARTQKISSLPALRILTRHSSNEVVKHAGKVLCAMGQQVDAVPVAGPVLFQILLNDKPLGAGRKISWRVMSAAGSDSSSAAVENDGVVGVPRDQFSNPRRPATKVQLRSLEGDRDVVFQAEMSPPWDLDGITEVRIQLRPLDITLLNREGLNAPEADSAFVTITRVSDDKATESARAQDADADASEFSYRPRVFDEANVMKADPSIHLPPLQDGKYELWIGVPGAEVWHGGVTVGPTSAKVNAALRPGSDVRFEIVTPDGQRGPWARLFRNGKPFALHMDYRTHTCRSLPCGTYVLKIPGSDPNNRDPGGKQLTKGPDEIWYEGRDVSFTIEKGSPALIDLGEIHLKPLAGK